MFVSFKKKTTLIVNTLCIFLSSSYYLLGTHPLFLYLGCLAGKEYFLNFQKLYSKRICINYAFKNIYIFLLMYKIRYQEFCVRKVEIKIDDFFDVYMYID